MRTWLTSLILSFGWLCVATARESITLDLKVEQTARQALVFPAPATDKKSDVTIPLVLCFHGHGGNAQQASNSFKLHDAWAEAIVVYPQGLPTPGQLTDTEGKRNGWQAQLGAQEDRDVKFFDALLVELKRRYPIDPKRVFVMGHSNGGGFTYLLWATRSKEIAAVAPCAAMGLKVVEQLTPKPCLHIAGKIDDIVRFAWQEKMMGTVKRINRCEETGKAWATDCLLYEPAVKGDGAPMVQCINNGTHRYPENATALMVKFFREVSMK